MRDDLKRPKERKGGKVAECGGTKVRLKRGKERVSVKVKAEQRKG